MFESSFSKFRRLFNKLSINFLKSIYHFCLLLVTYFLDFFRFNRSKFSNFGRLNATQLQAKITIYYHSIEKGLSNINFRYGFGRFAVNNLIEAITEYSLCGYDKSNTAFVSGIAVLNEYITKHSSTESVNAEINQFIIVLSSKLSFLKENTDRKLIGGIIELNIDYFLGLSKSNFTDLAYSRFSIRDYAEEKVESDIVSKALMIASKTPSTCNRQPWHTFAISDLILINKILTIQGGLNGQGHNISHLLVVCSDNYNFSNYTERNQGFIDGGMYSMSILYALTHMGVASCPLNANLTVTNEIKIRKLLNLKYNLNIVMFISIGNYMTKNKVPISNRYSVLESTTFLKGGVSN